MRYGTQPASFDKMAGKEDLRFLILVSLWLQEGLPLSFWRGEKNAYTEGKRKRKRETWDYDSTRRISVCCQT